MNRFVMFLLLLILTLSFAGCARLQTLLGNPPRWKVASGPDTGKNWQRLEPVIYFSYLQTLPEPELEEKYQAVKERFDAGGNEDDRWRLIFFSLLPGHGFSDSDYALRLLQERRQDSTAEYESQRALAELLTMLLQERRDLDGKWKAEKERADRWAKQLKELKEIEEILSERNKKYPAEP
jgi:hypothetical protein